MSETPSIRTANCEYRLMEILAEGGIGETHSAHDVCLHRRVDMQLLKQRFISNPDYQKRFEREARICANLEHSTVVPIYTFGRDRDGRSFYTQRHVRGHVLRIAIQNYHKLPPSNRAERSLSLRRLLASFVAVCNGIGFAHSLGIIHGDIKPENILLAEFGETFILEWGLAKALDSQLEIDDVCENTAAIDSSNTSVPEEFRGVAGPPAYMSPEQAAGNADELGPASDVFNLGATLYEILTGNCPYHDIADGVFNTVRAARLARFPKPRERTSDVSIELEAICLKAMARDPQDRYDSALALADDIERWMAGCEISAKFFTALNTAVLGLIISAGHHQKSPIEPRNRSPVEPPVRERYAY